MKTKNYNSSDNFMNLMNTIQKSVKLILRLFMMDNLYKKSY